MTDRVPANIQRKAKDLRERVRHGADLRSLKGHPLRHDRAIISFELGRRYRMLGRRVGDGWAFTPPMSHEAYNATKPSGRFTE